MTKFFARAFALLAIILPQTLVAQDLDSLLNISAFTEESELQKVLNKNVTVSSSKALTTRETPGIISLVTAEEIQNSGARDLTDILRLVPGFDIAQDLQFVMGIGLRGNWANEGKVLVLMDGQPFNELLYQTVAIGNRFPVDAIERIEIIRGPGSAIYGGSAEYGVVNIITRAAESLNGVAVYGTGGFHAGAVGRTNGGVMIAQKNEQGVSWDLSFFKGKGIVSDDANYSPMGESDTYDLASTTKANPMNVNLGLRYEGLSVRTMYDVFETQEPLTFISYKDFYIDVKYDFQVSKKFTLTPQIKYLNQIPWQYGDAETGEDTFKGRAERTYGALTGMYDLSRKVNLNAGLLYFQDKATDLLESGYFLGGNTISFKNYAVFGQALFKHRLANATIGFRYERNTQYGSAFVPRLGLTKRFGNLHFKALYSQAFRAPAIENINLAESGDGTIEPEKSNVFELELGYQFTPEMLLAVNAFSIRTNDVIVYNDDGQGGTYRNFDKSGTRGIEAVYSIRKKKWYANLTYALAKALSGDSIVDLYTVPQTSKQYVGFPQHKISLNANYSLTEKISFNCSFIQSGARYAYTDFYQNGDPFSKKLDPYLLINAYLNFKNIIKGLNAGMGVYDILNERPSIPQAYQGEYAPIPGRSREYVVKLSYQLDFKK
jgi:outer membrane cobalamin receptor